ncbi:YraN family protein [Alicyclobacillaceae bacterium I2511]|nr:YraN family protein [Alicyclobacillaceae bacterium I2511]
MFINPELNCIRLGQWSEQVAVEYLQKTLGWQILQRNWRCPVGELDIIAMQDECTVIVEVRSRHSDLAGVPMEVVGHRKVVQLRRVVRYWLSRFSTSSDIPDLRLDVIILRWQHKQVAEILHIRGALGWD